MNHLTFRSSRIIYYGPHACENCGVPICKMGHEFGGNAFTYPDGPIYPNTEWHPHVCDPKRVAMTPKAVDVPAATPSPKRPPFETFKRPTCKGCFALGTACGNCEKCDWELAERRQAQISR